jgi:ligand-binding sensor domain-containing protein
MVNKKLLPSIILYIFICLSFNSCNNDDPIENQEIPFETVNGFVINEKGDKLLATEKGLYSFDEKTADYKFVTSTVELIPVNDLVYSKKNPVKELWLASDNGILNFASQQHLTSVNSGLYSNVVNHLDFDFKNRGFFASTNRLSIVDNSKWIQSTGSNDLFSKFPITDIASASNGFTYVTTKGGGIERFEMDVDGISGATIFDTDWSRLESNNINTVFIDSITQVYGTDAGVAMHFSEFTKWDWETYSSTDGLVNDTVIAVVKDKSKNWWFGTKKGLSSFNNSKWTNYSVETHNIISNNIKFLAVDIDGTVWFASDKGLSHFIGGKWINYSK